MRWTFLAFVGAALAGLAWPAARAAQPVPAAAAASAPLTAEQLYAPPRIASVTLSPDGRRLAMSAHTAGRNVIAVYDLDAGTLAVAARDPDWDLIRPVWVNDHRIAYKTWDYGSTLANNRAGAWYAIDIDGTQRSQLWRSVAQSQAEGRSAWTPMTYLAPGDAASAEMLVTLTDRAPPGSADRFPGSDVYAVNTVTGRSRLLTEDNPGEVQSWYADALHRVRAALSMRVDRASGKARYETWYRAAADGPWRLLTRHLMDEPGFEPAGFDAEGSLYVVGRADAATDTAGLYRWDFATNQVGEAIARDASADIAPEDLLFDAQGHLAGIDLNAMQRERRYFAPALRQLQRDVDAALPGRHNRLFVHGDRGLVISSSDLDPGTLYRLDVTHRKLKQLFQYLPQLSGHLAPKHVITYRARDGQTIPAYLTLPRGQAAAGLPLVVFPHGGPAERDDWGVYWDENEPLVQLLAARGIAVLQPQYRGSLGFGWRLYHDGWKQWAGTSVDDVMDGVQALVARGTVDAARVCTMGKSSGGYTAMYLLIKYPQAFRCGVSWAGTTEMSLFFSEPDAAYAGSAWLNHIAPWTHVAPDETAAMAAASVVRNAQHIRVPVLLAYGSADHVVPIAHGQQLHEALLRDGTPVQWIVYPDEAHGWVLRSDQIAFAQAVEQFFAQHLTGEASRKSR